MHARRAVIATAPAMVLAAVAVAVAGCGKQQDAGVPKGTWTVAIPKFSFVKRQPLGKPQVLELVVRNDDRRAIPQLAITVAGLDTPVQQQGSATPTRPVWIVDSFPGTDSTSRGVTTRTFNLGPLDAGVTRDFKLHVTPIRRGVHTISYSVAANIYGSGKAVLAGGAAAAGSEVVSVDPTPVFNEKVFQ